MRCGAECARLQRNAALLLLEPASVVAEGPIWTEALKLRPDVKNKCREGGRKTRERRGAYSRGSRRQVEEFGYNKQQITTRAVFLLLFLHLLCRGLTERIEEGEKMEGQHGE